jgi:hypothetical protein
MLVAHTDILFSDVATPEPSLQHVFHEFFTNNIYSLQQLQWHMHIWDLFAHCEREDRDRELIDLHCECNPPCDFFAGTYRAEELKVPCSLPSPICRLLTTCEFSLLPAQTTRRNFVVYLEGTLQGRVFPQQKGLAFRLIKGSVFKNYLFLSCDSVIPSRCQRAKGRKLYTCFKSSRVDRPVIEHLSAQGMLDSRGGLCGFWCPNET